MAKRRRALFPAQTLTLLPSAVLLVDGLAATPPSSFPKRARHEAAEEAPAGTDPWRLVPHGGRHPGGVSGVLQLADAAGVCGGLWVMDRE